MHVIIDDNVQPINPFTATALPAGTTVASFASYDGTYGLTTPSGVGVLMPPPTATAATCTPGGGGSLPVATYYFEVTALDGEGGQTLPSAEASCQLTGSGSATVNWVAQGATSFRVYYGTISGMEGNYYSAVIAPPTNAFSYVITSAAGPSAPLPTYPTAASFRSGLSGLTYATGGGLDLGVSPAISEFPNQGTQLYYLAILDSLGVTTTTSQPTNIVGVCVGGCGVAGSPGNCSNRGERYDILPESRPMASATSRPAANQPAACFNRMRGVFIESPPRRACGAFCAWILLSIRRDGHCESSGPGCCRQSWDRRSAHASGPPASAR